MDFQKRSIRRSQIKPAYSDLQELYPHNLQFYKTPPNCEITLLELEECCAQRLSILQTLGEVTNRGLKGEEWRKTFFDELRKQGLKGFRKLFTNTSFKEEKELYEMRKQDHISHFMLMISYCDNEDKRRWFISRELELFRYRWSYLSVNDKNEFLSKNTLNYDMVEESEKQQLMKMSLGMMQSIGTYYKVPFATVSDLVRMRKVFLSKGIAFILSDDMISVILSTFRSALSRRLAFAARRIDDIAEDTRISSLLKGAGKRERDVDYKAYVNRGNIDIQNLDTLAQMSYPLCMQNLHQRLRKDHHLKHFARLQYTLFLKGIGVTLDDALRFWRSEFCKKIDPEKFEKQYSYNIRHSFGKAGKMANYSPQSCLKIITSSVGVGDAHGCPFKQQDQNTLKKTLQQNGLSSMDCQEVIDFVRKGHFQIACGTYFQKLHDVSTFIVNHPNHYFDESQMVLDNQSIKTEKKDGGEAKSQLGQRMEVDEDVWANDSGFDFASISETVTS